VARNINWGSRLKHGHSAHGARRREYNAWMNMKQRCSNKNAPNYERYGALGISVCARWWKSYENFLADMGPCPSGASIERKDNALGYNPNNCKWATQNEQARNKRSTISVVWNGVTMCQVDACRCAGLPLSTVRRRIHDGWAVQRALTEPVQNKFRRKVA